jgi:hypothetical protein
MQESIQSNLLIWDNITNIPFPKDTLEIIKNVDWSQYIWQTIGLPIPFAKYSIVEGKSLYLDEMPDGTTNLKRCEFTGDILMSGFFVDEKKEHGYNYLLTFIVTILKGNVIEVSLKEEQKQDLESYEKAYLLFEKKFNKNFKILNSKTYKYIYIPYSIILRTISYFIIWLLNLLVKGIVYITNKLTPI